MFSITSFISAYVNRSVLGNIDLDIDYLGFQSYSKCSKRTTSLFSHTLTDMKYILLWQASPSIDTFTYNEPITFRYETIYRKYAFTKTSDLSLLNCHPQNSNIYIELSSCKSFPISVICRHGRIDRSTKYDIKIDCPVPGTLSRKWNCWSGLHQMSTG